MSKQYRFIFPNYVLHIGLMITISKVAKCSPSSVYSACLGIVVFSKPVSSSFKWVAKYILCRSKLEGELNWIELERFIILFLPCLWEYGTLCQFLKQISKLCLQLTVQVYSLLAQTEEERKAFFEVAKRRWGAMWH